MNRYFIPIFVVVILGNILGYWVKSIVKDNGYSVKYFSGHFRDTLNLFKLVKSPIDKRTRTKYLIIAFSEIALTITFIVFGVHLFLSLPSLNDAACNRFKDFKSEELNAVVINKYLDSNEHSYSTLILEDKNGIITKNQDLVTDRSGLFDYILIGDTITKQGGTEFVKIVNAKRDSTFQTDFGCE